MKKALIVANLSGFVGFLKKDIEILQNMGYQVFYAAKHPLGEHDATMEYLEAQNITFFNIDFSSKNPFAKENMRAYRTLKRIIKDEGFELIHCHTPIAGFLTRLAARKARRRGAKVIYTTHGLAFCSTSSKKEWLKYFWIEKIASRYTDAIITINHEDFENAKRLWCKNVYYIHGVGVDIKQYHDVDIDVEVYKAEVGIPQGKTVVLSVGELSHRKNHQVIIRALATLPNKDEYTYIICGREVGGGGFAQKLEDLARELGVDLHLLGHRKDIPQITVCSDIGAIPSLREGLGLAGVQSLAAGVPLVGASVQGIRDYIIPGETGYLYTPYDVEGYAEGLKVLSCSATRARMAERCYEVAQQFDIAVSREEMAEIYASILQKDQ